MALLLVVVLALVDGFLPSAPALSEPASPSVEIPGVVTSGYHARYLVPPNPLNQLNGMTLDGEGGVFVCAALYDRIVHLDLRSGAIRVVADETHA